MKAVRIYFFRYNIYRRVFLCDWKTLNSKFDPSIHFIYRVFRLLKSINCYLLEKIKKIPVRFKRQIPSPPLQYGINMLRGNINSDISQKTLATARRRLRRSNFLKYFSSSNRTEWNEIFKIIIRLIGITVTHTNIHYRCVEQFVCSRERYRGWVGFARYMRVYSDDNVDHYYLR